MGTSRSSGACLQEGTHKGRVLHHVLQRQLCVHRKQFYGKRPLGACLLALATVTGQPVFSDRRQRIVVVLIHNPGDGGRCSVRAAVNARQLLVGGRLLLRLLLSPLGLKGGQEMRIALGAVGVQLDRLGLLLAEQPELLRKVLSGI